MCDGCGVVIRGGVACMVVGGVNVGGNVSDVGDVGIVVNIGLGVIGFMCYDMLFVGNVNNWWCTG